jgi:acetyl esterase/lipase
MTKGIWMRGWMNRLFVFLAVTLLASSLAQAQKHPCTTAGDNNDFLGIRTIRLWPGDAPEAKGKTCEDVPTLTIFEPQRGYENSSAVVIFPGGAYSEIVGNAEGRQVADWFTARGFRAFVLSYRLSSNGYLLPVPLLDARRAIQTVRARAKDYFIAPNRIVVIGFSAGGHLAALSGTQFVPGNPGAQDPLERVSSRPDYLVLGYPWIGAISLDTSRLNYCKLFNLTLSCQQLSAAYSPDLFVSKETPPTFWLHTFTDDVVPVEQGLRFYAALVKAGVPAEVHIFANGRHGIGLGEGDTALDEWPSLLEMWLRGQGLLVPDKSVEHKLLHLSR